MKLHVFQHIEHEGPSQIATWARRKGFEINTTRWFAGETEPALDEIDWLVVMGGFMNIYEHRNHPWLVREKRFLESAIHAGKKVLGICLGAQLIADALGGKVYQNPEKEIGWFPIQWLPSARQILPGLPESSRVLHWHGDTFDLPPGAHLLAESPACRNQAFTWKKQALAFQFHIEVAPDVVAEFSDFDRAELVPARYVQSEAEILAGVYQCGPNMALLQSWLDWLYPGV
ncbi:MAG: type 1 glutamine amidotransferase [Methylacidiphilales bacterium]|nr:type 1 glutamine amidotransferase [Candidatus Methylacidiphilales bacterium]